MSVFGSRCHCRWCQRETGTAFALNAMIDWVMLPAGVPSVPQFYEIERYWSPESLARREAFLPRLRAHRGQARGA